ncbi:ester cyclase [Gemmata sp.]|uniref:ester cyclase n=1 Tax=Gemmata sp. TaxID=1914242 RepID=UPI003F6F8F4E
MSPKDVLLAWVKGFNERDADALVPLYHPGATNHQVAAGEPAVGRDAIIRGARDFFAAFPDSYTRVEAVYQDGDVVAPEWSGGATWLGAFAGHAPSGRTFTLRGCGFFRIEGGQIVHQRGYWDRAGWFLQLGIPVA